MNKLTVRHKVKDFGPWKKVYDEHRTVREKYGIRDVDVQRSVDSENEVLITMEITDLAKAREFSTSDELKKAMAKGGVLGPPEVFIGTTV